MNNSNLAYAVINHITSKTISSDANLQLEASQSLVHTSSFAALAGSAKDFEVKTITITGNQTFANANGGTAVWPPVGNEWQYIIPNGNTVPNGNILPYVGDGPYPYVGDPPYNGGEIYPPLPQQPWPPNGIVFPPQTGTIKIVPDLEQLEEGVHDIKGGKVIIKKIKITEEQLATALEEELGHSASPEEKQKLHEDLEAIAASEERDV
jgi:hypothetical protein